MLLEWDGKGDFAVEYLSHSEQETEQLGERIAKKLPRGTVIAYSGELGMEKPPSPAGLRAGLAAAVG